METINISGIDKFKLLKALWYKAKLASYFKDDFDPPHFKEEAAKKELEMNTTGQKSRIDYLFGRAIKCDFSTDDIRYDLYDRDTYNGAFKEIVDNLRKEKD